MESVTVVKDENLTGAIPRPSTLVELLRRRALEEPAKLAYTFLVDGDAEELCLTYGELDSRARRIAAVLQQVSKPGERALLLYPPGLGYVAAFFGCLYAGLIAVPAYPPDPSRFSRSLPRLRAIVEDARATVALTTELILNRAQPLFDESPFLKTMNWLAPDAVEENLANDWRELQAHADSLAFLQYTSGSTGKPKGVMLTHRNLLHNAGLVYHGVEHKPADLYVSWLPTFHDMGFMAGILQPLYAGIPVVSMSPVAFLQQPFLWLQAISRYRATTSGGPNFAYDLCAFKITREQRATLDLSSWSVAFNGAEPIRNETLERFAAVFGPCGFRREAFYPCYGLAEATLIVTGSKKSAPPVVKNFSARALENNSIAEASPADKSARTLAGCGHVLLEQRVLIVNPDTLRQCADDEVGEIWIAGDSVAQGYWNNPDETEKIFKARLTATGEGPFLRTGDLGCLREGELYVTGRLKDLIIIRGRNHYPQDIELTAERSHRSLRPGCGAAFSVDDGGAERLVIVQEINYREEPDVNEVIGRIREAVSEQHELETAAVVLIKPGRILKTTSGKIQRRACRAAFLAGTFEIAGEWRAPVVAPGEMSVATAAPERGDVQGWLASQIATRAGVALSRIDVTQPLTRYGIDSLAAIELAHAIETELDALLPMSSLLHGYSIAELAAQISECQKVDRRATLTPASQTYPLSAGQKALWFLSQLAPESPVYHINSVARVLSGLDTSALQRAFQALVDRHASLRTTFHVVDGQPFQKIHERCVLPFEESDASVWSEEQLSERLVSDVNRPFELEAAPLLRVNVYRRGAGEYVLLLVVHHLVADFWSLAVLTSELGLLYAQERSGAVTPLPESSSNYSAHVRRQKELLESAEGERLWSYWQKQLSGDVQPLNLPTRGPRPAVQTYRGDSVSFLLDEDLTARLNELSRLHEATLYMTLLSAFEVLLQRYADQDEFFVGSPTAGRDHAGFAGVIGYFVNPVVLRAKLSGSLTFEEHLLRVRQTVLEAFEHQHYPFPLLVERLQPERDASRSPVFQVMCALQNAHSAGGEGLGSFALGHTGAQLRLGELQLESLALEERVAQFDLTLMMSEVGGRLSGALQFNSDLFNRETIERMALHFQTLVESIVAEPRKRLSELSLLTPDEAQRVFVEWNNTAFEYPAGEGCVQRAFEAQVELLPGAPAVVCGDEQITYCELNERSNQLARYLQKRGVRPEVTVGVLLERSIEMVVSLLGILKAGGAYVPLDPLYPQERLSFMLNDSQSVVLLTRRQLVENFSGHDIDVLCLDTDWSSIAGEDVTNLQVDVELENLAYMIYTSGSTGGPKGVEIPHAGLNNLVMWHQRAYGITSGDRATLLAGPAFDASVWELWPYLTAGASVHIPDDETRASAPALLQWLAAQSVTVCFLPTPLAELVIAEPLSPELSLRALLTGGDVLHRGPESPLPFILVNHYGPTENTVVATRGAVALETETGAPPPIGRPIDNTQTYLLDSRLQPVVPGVPGELYTGGAGLARGYHLRPSLTAEKFIPNPFSAEAGARLYATGDLARYLPDGQLEFLGRIDQQVKVRGYRIELGEIESMLCEHSQVREATVLAWEETPGNMRLAAYFVPQHANVPVVAGLNDFLKTKLPDYMVPSVFVALERMPLTPNGKVDRKALPSPSDALRDGTSSVDPRTPIEQLVAGIYSHVLGVRRVGVHDNFFELGGHSLLATQVMSRVRQSFGIEMPLSQLFMSPTVAGFAAHIEEATRDGLPIPSLPLSPILRDGELPLSFAQQRLWFLNQFEPDSPFYNIPAALRLRGQLDTVVLEQSLNEIVRRHESLRTGFKSAHGEPVQIIAPFQHFNLEFEDLSDLTEEEKKVRMRELTAQEACRPFDLLSNSLLRVRLLRLETEAHVLLLTMHHIISDGWSVRLLVRELSQLYSAFSRGETSPLPELALQYVDYAAWQRQQLQGPRLESELTYWREQLAEAPAVLELPADHPRPAVQSFRGAHCSRLLPAELTSALRATCRRAGVTRYMFLLAAFYALLSRYTGQRDLLVGTPVANRTRVETEGLVGLFANTLVLRARLSDEPCFSELLQQVRETVLGAHQHQELPFERLVEELQPERDLSRTPLFQVMFVAEEEATGGWQLPGLELSAERVETGTSKFELTLFVTAEDEGLRLTAEYNTDLFAAQSMERLLGHYGRLLEAAVADAGQPVDQLSMLSAAEREQLLVEWNETRRGYGGELLPEMFAAQVGRTPDRVALICEGRELSYAELDGRANQLAQLLRARGVGPETRVGVLLERDMELVIGLLAVLKAGGAYVPLDAAYPQERLAFMLADCGARLLLTQRRVLERLEWLAGQEMEAVVVDELASEGVASDFPIAISAANLAYVIYTSGSTGQPKGVAITHHSASVLLRWSHEQFTPAELAGVLCSTSVCFDLSIFELFAPLTAGGTVILAPNALELPELAARERVTLLNTVPSAMRELLRVGGLPSSVMTVNLAGEPLPGRLAEDVYTQQQVKQLWNLYGPTEDTTYSTAALLGRGAAPTIGKPVAETRAYVLDERLEPVAVGVRGNLYLGGEGLARGYLNRPWLTAERFVPDPHSDRPGARMYRTGDMARWLATGELEYMGRLDHQVKVRGYRIELGEIEAAIAEQEAVSECVVVAREEESGEVRLVAYVVLNEGVAAPTQAQLRLSLQRRLPEHMVPSLFVTLKALPLTPNGKVDRKALPAPERELAAAEYVAARTEVEEVVCGIWAEVLGVERVGIYDNFFELGGHSLLATQALARVREALRVELPLRALFEEPTVAGLAARVERTRGERVLEDEPVLVRLSREGGAAAEVSFAQQRLWFLDQLEPESGFYNIAGAVRLRGVLDVTALKCAVAEVVRRHESLRTRFTAADGRPSQIIESSVSVPLQLVNLCELGEAEKDAKVLSLAREEAQRPFDLSQGPLLRTNLLKLDTADHILLVTLHHIISDGWSISVLMREVATLYEAYSKGESSPLPELSIQYADYAAWQRERLRGNVLERELAYWKQQLAGAATVLELPTDHPRPPVQTFRGATQTFQLSEELTGALKTLSRSQSVTLFTTLMAAFNVLLHRYTGQGDILAGTPIANRKHIETEKLIGYFANTLVLRTKLDDKPTFKELLQRVWDATLDASLHQDLPFERLVEELQPDRDLSRTPLFQVMFVFQNAPQAELHVSDLSIDFMTSDSGTARFDLTLSVADTPGGLTGTLEYNTDLFAAQSMERLLGHYGRLLEAAVADAGQPVDQLSMLSAAEREQLLVEWNETWRGYGGELLPEMFAAQVRRTPDRVALICEGRELSYAELDGRANQLAQLLRARGVGPETRVGVLLERDMELVIGLLAVLKAGGAYVPLDAAYPQERIAFMLADCGARLLLTQRRVLERLEWLAGPEMEAVVVDELESEGVAPDLPLAISAANLAYVIYTSGSTGQPKGVAITHHSASVLLRWSHEQFTPAELAGVLCSTSVCFDLSIFELFAPLTAGGTVILAPNALELPELAARERVTLINTVPSAMRELLRVGGLPSSVMTVNLAGEPLTRRLAEDVYAEEQVQQLWNLYGPTEDTTYSTAALLGRGAEPTIGKPLAETRAYVLDQRLEPVAVGVRGDLYLGGEGLARGYLNRPLLTAERFVPDPHSDQPGARMYRTGDMARWLAAGELEYLGRLDHQVKVRGYRIELGEVETAVTAHKGISECVCLARAEEPGDVGLVAYVVAANGAALTPTEMREWLRQRLPEYMVPSLFVTLKALPLTPNGKVDRKALPAPERELAAAEYVAARTEVEEVVCGIWAEVLGVARVGIYDNFFELGGHSLLATQALARVREALRVELPLRALFEEPTVAGLAARVERTRRERVPEDEPVLVRLSREGGAAAAVSFAQQRLWFLDQLEPESGFYNIAGAVRLRGVLDVAALECAVAEVVRRHESLRTRFTTADGRPIQLVEPSVELEVPLIDLRETLLEGRESRAQQLVAEEAQRPFDLSRAPLIRVVLLRLDTEAHVLLLTLHHIISDGWSVRLLVRELSQLYSAFSRGETSPLPELALQYVDYAAWQRQQLQGPRLESELTYWRAQLAAAPAVLELPADHPRPAVQSFRGAHCSRLLPAELTHTLRATCRRAGVTRYMFLLAAFYALLSRYTGQRDLLVGTPVANRTRVETEDLVGLFANTLVLRARLSDEPSFNELLQRVRETVLGAHQHQELPFERLVEELQPERDLSRTPLFQVMFVAEEEATGGWQLPGVELSAERVETGTSKFELTLFVTAEGEGLRLTAEYNTDLFAAQSMERLLGHYGRLLEAAVADAGQPVDQLAMLSAAEREQLLVEWNETRRGYGGELLPEMFAAQVRRTPDRVALICEGRELSYAELDGRANQLAQLLRARGVGPETRVGVLLERGMELVIGLLAVLKAGGAYVPLDAAYPQERIAFMLADCGARLLLTQRRVLERLEWLAGPEMEAVVVDELESESVAADLPLAISAANLAYVIYTSGSMGQPKGVAITHHSASVLLRWSHEQFTPAELAGVLCSTSVCFDLSIFELFAPLTAGGAVILAPNALELPELAARERVTLINTVPSAMRELLRVGGVPSSVMTVNLAGEPLTRRLADDVYAQEQVQQLWNLYGPTEDTTYSTAALLGRGAEPTIGKPVAETRAYVLDERLEPVAVGVRGDLYLGGEGLARGYLNRAWLTAERFVPDPHSDQPGARMYRTGDVARWLAAGELEYLGRLDHQVKVRGYRIELGEIEAALAGQEAVSECVVVAGEEESADKRLVAYVVLHEGVAAPTQAQLRLYLQRRLPEHMVPSLFVTLKALPLTPNGKVDRKALPLPERELAAAEYVAARTEVEEVVCGIWAEVLGVERVGIYDNFFELGGHSLLATQVTFSIRERLRVELPLRRIFETPTVAGLAEFVDGMGRNGASVIKPVSRDRYRVKGFTPQALTPPKVLREA